jgi:hypothetical protein
MPATSTAQASEHTCTEYPGGPDGGPIRMSCGVTGETAVVACDLTGITSVCIERLSPGTVFFKLYSYAANYGAFAIGCVGAAPDTNGTLNTWCKMP